jgi:hypothetical protein
MRSINRTVVVRILLAAFTIFLAGNRLAAAADFSVTSPGSFYSFNGAGANPTITLVRGKTYTFALSTSGSHPFKIATSLGGAAPAGVSGNNDSSSGTITFAVPANAPDCVYYCTIHFFSGAIHMIEPPTPPEVKFVSITPGTNLVFKTTQLTTNGFAFIPEANTNLLATNWFALTVKSNRFSSGTNEIFCGSPVATNAFFRIRIQ